MAFIDFMSSTAGRAVRIVAGLVLIVVGFAVVGGIGGLIVSLIGLVPLFTGVANVCLLAPLAGGSRGEVRS